MGRILCPLTFLEKMLGLQTCRIQEYRGVKLPKHTHINLKLVLHLLKERHGVSKHTVR